MRIQLALALVAPLALLGCKPGTGSVIPVTPPAVVMPAEVQQACQVLAWAVPAASAFITISDNIRRYIDAAQPALAACAAGNADATIVSLAAALQDLLYRRGVRPPAGVPMMVRR